MADSVTTNVVFSGSRRYIVHLTNKSDGTGEAAVIKVDKSTLTNGKGVEPTKLNVEGIVWNVQGFTSVQLLWDHNTDDLIANLGLRTGILDFSHEGVLKDPASAGGAGDILLTTTGAAVGATYDILLSLVMSD
jgi:hypothetical protein